MGRKRLLKIKDSNIGAREKPLENVIYNICSVAEFALEKAKKVFKLYYFKIL